MSNRNQQKSEVQKIILLIKIALLLLPLFSFSQVNKDSTYQLEKLTGFTQTFYYSHGHKERARTIAKFMEDAGIYFDQTIKYRPAVNLFVLAEEDWEKIAAAPLKDVYGFPHNVNPNRLVLAATDNNFWRSFLQNTADLPPSMAEKIKQVYARPDGSYSLMPFFDLLALHEFGHSYTSQAGLKMQRYWMGELFVNIMLHTFVAEKRPGLLPALETFPNMVIARGSAAFKFTTLEDFERLYRTLGMGPENYGWYQCKLHAAAATIYNTGGKTVLVKLWKALKEHKEDLTDQAFAEMLAKEVHPSVADVYLNWNKGI